MSNFSFSHSVFKKLGLQARKTQGLLGKQLKTCVSLLCTLSLPWVRAALCIYILVHFLKAIKPLRVRQILHHHAPLVTTRPIPYLHQTSSVFRRSSLELLPIAGIIYYTCSLVIDIQCTRHKNAFNIFFNELCAKITLLISILKKNITVCNPVYFRLCILLHQLQPRDHSLALRIIPIHLCSWLRK